MPKEQENEEALNAFCDRVKLELLQWFSENETLWMFTNVEREFARQQMVAGKIPITVAHDFVTLRYALGPVYAEAELRALNASTFTLLMIWTFGEKFVENNGPYRIVVRRWRGELYVSSFSVNARTELPAPTHPARQQYPSHAS